MASDTDSIDIPAYVRGLRKRFNLTQEQLADRVGVSFATVNRWEAGTSKPQRAQLETLRALEQSGGAAHVETAPVAPKPASARAVETWTWDDLLSWACWEVITGITKGHGLNSVMHRILSVATQWKPPAAQKGGKRG